MFMWANEVYEGWHLNMNIPSVGLNKEIVFDLAFDSPECQQKDQSYYVF